MLRKTNKSETLNSSPKSSYVGWAEQSIIKWDSLDGIGIVGISAVSPFNNKAIVHLKTKQNNI